MLHDGQSCSPTSPAADAKQAEGSSSRAAPPSPTRPWSRSQPAAAHAMSEVAGRMSIQVGATALQKAYGGFRHPPWRRAGRAAANVVILGGASRGRTRPRWRSVSARRSPSWSVRSSACASSTPSSEHDLHAYSTSETIEKLVVQADLVVARCWSPALQRRSSSRATWSRAWKRAPCWSTSPSTRRLLRDQPPDDPRGADLLRGRRDSLLRDQHARGGARTSPSHSPTRPCPTSAPSRTWGWKRALAADRLCAGIERARRSRDPRGGGTRLGYDFRLSTCRGRERLKEGPIPTCLAWLAEAGAASRPTRRPRLATATPTCSLVRMVPGAAAARAGLRVLHQPRQRKARELAANPRASAVPYWVRARAQSRVEGSSCPSTTPRRTPTSKPSARPRASGLGSRQSDVMRGASSSRAGPETSCGFPLAAFRVRRSVGVPLRHERVEFCSRTFRLHERLSTCATARAGGRNCLFPEPVQNSPTPMPSVGVSRLRSNASTGRPSAVSYRKNTGTRPACPDRSHGRRLAAGSARLRASAWSSQRHATVACRRFEIERRMASAS